MSTPTVPNFNPGSLARIATDRYDFQNHIDGYSFRHVANNIDVSPPITISSVDYTNVQTALAALAAVIVPSVTVPDASLTTKGILQLIGDLGGTATNVRVIRIQGNSISNLAPTNGGLDLGQFNLFLEASYFFQQFHSSRRPFWNQSYSNSCRPSRTFCI